MIPTPKLVRTNIGSPRGRFAQAKENGRPRTNVRTREARPLTIYDSVSQFRIRSLKYSEEFLPYLRAIFFADVRILGTAYIHGFVDGLSVSGDFIICLIHKDKSKSVRLFRESSLRINSTRFNEGGALEKAIESFNPIFEFKANPNRAPYSYFSNLEKSHRNNDNHERTTQ